MATNNRIPFVVTYHPGLPNIGSILRELHPFLHYSERRKQAIRDVPMMAFHRPEEHTRLFSSLAQSCDPWIRLLEGTEGLINVRVIDLVGDIFSSHVTGTSYTVNHRLHCNSRNVVYLISCKVCGLQYVGSTTTKFRLRFNNHKSRLRAHSTMSAANKDKDDTIYKHFHSDEHHGLRDIKVHLIDKVNAKDNLLAKEGQ